MRRINDRGGSVYLASEIALSTTPARPSFVRRLFGDQSVSRIYLPPPAFSAADHMQVGAAFPEAYIWPAGAPSLTAATPAR